MGLHRNTAAGRRAAMRSKAAARSHRKPGGSAKNASGSTPWIRQAAAYSPKVGAKIRATSPGLSKALAKR